MDLIDFILQVFKSLATTFEYLTAKAESLLPKRPMVHTTCIRLHSTFSITRLIEWVRKSTHTVDAYCHVLKDFHLVNEEQKLAEFSRGQLRIRTIKHVKVFLSLLTLVMPNLRLEIGLVG